MSLKCERRSKSNAPAISEDGKLICGLGAVYYDPKDPGTEYVYQIADPRSPRGDLVTVKERIFPGAFTHAIEHGDIVCAYNHEHNIGRRTAGDANSTMTIVDTPKGPEYRVQRADHMWGDMVYKAIQRGDVRGSSFLFVPRPGGQVWKQDGNCLIRELRDLDTYDMGPVDQPAYKATTSELRAEDVAEIRSLAPTGSSAAPASPDPAAIVPTPEPPSVDRRDHDRLATVLALTPETRSMSYGEVTSKLAAAIRDQLETLTGSYVYAWPDAVYPDYVIYCMGDPPVYYKQGYTIDGADNVTLVGAAEKVKPNTIWEPLTAAAPAAS